MKFESRLLKGIVPIVVFEILSSTPMYGYELSLAIAGRMGDILSLGKGTLYHLLYILETKQSHEIRLYLWNTPLIEYTSH